MAPTALPRIHEVEYDNVEVRAPRGMAFVFAADDEAGNTFERDARMLYPYVVQGVLSTGRVAEILGTDRLSVIDFYESSGLPWLSYGVKDLEDDLATMRSLGILSEGE